VKQPGTLVMNEDREYLLVEGGFNSDTRAVILLARPTDPTFPPDEKARPIRWAHQGEWNPVARWSPAELKVPDAKYEPKRDRILEILKDYVEAPREVPTVAWAARKKGNFAGSLEAALPMGLAVACHETREGAAALEDVDDIVPIENVAMFMTHLVREGYAGAMWNSHRPVFFCIDESQELQFLRVGPGPKGDRVELELLEDDDNWTAYEGVEQIEFIDNREACDNRLSEALGKTPILEWPDDNRLFTVGPAEGKPLVLQPEVGEDSMPHGVLFTNEEAAGSFREDNPADLVLYPVTDLTGFLTHSEMEGCVAALNPGGHRAASGILWSDGERVVLDSFSGFWKLEGSGFQPLE
jgi:hypothetical protein